MLARSEYAQARTRWDAATLYRMLGARLWAPDGMGDWKAKALWLPAARAALAQRSPAGLLAAELVARGREDLHDRIFPKPLAGLVA